MEDDNKVKDVAKFTLKKIGIKKICIIIFVAIIIFLCIQAAFIWFITRDEGTWNKDKKGNPSTYTKSANISAQNGINVDKNTLIKNILLSMGFSEDRINELTDQDIIRILGMEIKLGRKITTLDECTEAELLWCANEVYSKYLKKPEDLQKLLDAELVTQYPKIEGLSDGKLNGIIEFVRYETNPDTKQESVKKLQYIDNEQFTSKFNEYQQNGNQEVFNYFTLTEDGSAKIATWTREEGRYYSNNTAMQTDRKKIEKGITIDDIQGEDERYVTDNPNADPINAQYITYYIDEQIIPYKSMVQKYTLPFEYLWSLLVIGKDEEFVLQLADLAYDSEIRIGLFDNVTETTIINEKTYTEEFKERYELFKDGNLEEERAANGEWETEKYDYTNRNTVKTYTNNIQMELIYADTWSVKTVTEYENSVNEQQISNDVAESPNGEWEDDGSTERHWTKTHKSKDAEGNETETDVDYDEYLYKQKRTINIKNTTIQNSIKSEYQKKSTNSVGKIDKDIANGKNFVNLLLNTHNAFVSFQDISNVNWLEELLLANENTKGLVDLTKYLIKQATGNTAIDIEEFNFDVYNTSSFSDVSSIYGSDIHEKVWWALIDAGYSKIAAAAAMGNIEHESNFNSKCVQGDWRQPDRMQYDQNYTDRVNNGEISENDFVRHGPNGGGYGLAQWSYWSRKQGLYNYSKSLGVGIDDEDMQIKYLIAELTGKGDAIQCGASRVTENHIQGEGVNGTHDGWAKSEDLDEATLQYMRFFEGPGDISSLKDRRDAAHKYYEMFKDAEKPTVGGEGWSTQGVSCPHYYQGGQSWSSYPYNYRSGKTIADGGCGACALAMAVSGLTRTEVTPLEIVQYLNSIRTNTVYNGEGSAKAVAKKYGLTYGYIDRNNKTAVNQALDSGKCLVFSIKKNTIYTGDSGHYIMCYGRNGDNYFILESSTCYTMDRGYKYNQVFTHGSQGVFVLGK